ncbi:hypothetical protein F0Z19_3902 [Vibrio cyclitrophicus]|nr:hypothetical protein M565_ctg1P1741 [Vibrio cyclitrophicus FF75]KAA8597477.1 hypothetical protein F0Z19_3902 [Vibrio cyclitrophicus]
MSDVIDKTEKHINDYVYVDKFRKSATKKAIRLSNGFYFI